MKILQIVPHYLPATRFGGPQYVAHSLGKALIHQGHQVTVCTTNQKNEKEILPFAPDSPTWLDGIKIYYEPVTLFRYWGFSPMLLRRASTEIRDADFVFIHAHYQFANWIGAVLCRIWHKPYIIFAHGSLNRAGISTKSTSIKKLYLKYLEKKNFIKALFVVFNAPEELDYSMFSDRGEVVFSGIDPETFSNRPEVGSFRHQYPYLIGKTVFLFLGRLDIEQKALDLLLIAFSNILVSNPEAHLILAGPTEGESYKELEKLVNTLKIGKDVTFTGLIQGEEKISALQDADCFVLPSRFEGLSISLLEALYFGLPTLVSNQVGLWKLIKNKSCGLIVEPSIESITSGLLKMCNPEIRETMEGTGTNLIKNNFTWDIIAKDLIAKIYKRQKLS